MTLIKVDLSRMYLIGHTGRQFGSPVFGLWLSKLTEVSLLMFDLLPLSFYADLLFQPLFLDKNERVMFVLWNLRQTATRRRASCAILCGFLPNPSFSRPVLTCLLPALSSVSCQFLLFLSVSLSAFYVNIFFSLPLFFFLSFFLLLFQIFLTFSLH